MKILYAVQAALFTIIRFSDFQSEKTYCNAKIKLSKCVLTLARRVHQLKNMMRAALIDLFSVENWWNTNFKFLLKYSLRSKTLAFGAS